MIIRDINESKKNGKEANIQYSGVLREKMNLENQIRKQIKAIYDEKKKLFEEINALKAKVDELRKPSESQGYSIEFLHHKIAEK